MKASLPFIMAMGKKIIDVYAKLKTEVMDSIVDGRMTFQRAFMTGNDW